MIKNNLIFGKFKLGDKVWFSTPKKSKIPGIIESDKIQSVGKQRDIFIARGYQPFVPFEKISQEYIGKVTKRRKEFQGERGRLKLHHLGLEREYIDFKEKEVSMSKKEEELLHLVKENYRIGAYHVWYRDRGFTSAEIESLIDKGLIYEQKSDFHHQYILVPEGEMYI